MKFMEILRKSIIPLSRHGKPDIWLWDGGKSWRIAEDDSFEIGLGIMPS